MTRSTTSSSKLSANLLPQSGCRPRLEKLIRELIGQITKDSEPSLQTSQSRVHEEIIIDTVVDGERYLLIRMSVPTTGFKSLTPREQEIVRMVAKGYPNKTIAGVLNISCWTVGTHLRRTFAKLGVASRAAMIARIMEEHPTWDHLPVAEVPDRSAGPRPKPPTAGLEIARRPMSIAVAHKSA
jgi:DNA-binding CsgD family transcriptional regulator